MHLDTVVAVTEVAVTEVGVTVAAEAAVAVDTAVVVAVVAAAVKEEEQVPEPDLPNVLFRPRLPSHTTNRGEREETRLQHRRTPRPSLLLHALRALLATAITTVPEEMAFRMVVFPFATNAISQGTSAPIALYCARLRQPPRLRPTHVPLALVLCLLSAMCTRTTTIAMFPC